MIDVYVVTYYSCGSWHKCICGLDNKRSASALAREKSKRSGHYSQVWKSRGFWRDDNFIEVESTNVAIYECGKRQ